MPSFASVNSAHFVFSFSKRFMAGILNRKEFRGLFFPKISRCLPQEDGISRVDDEEFVVGLREWTMWN
jgi:hypothetical protein